MSDQGPPTFDQSSSLPPPPDEMPLPQRRVGEIISAAFDVYIKNAGRLLLIVAIVVVPLSILSYLLTNVVLGGTTKTVIIGNQTQEVVERGFFVALLAILVGAAITVVISAILQAAILRGAAQATLGDPVDVEASYRWGLRRFGSILLVSILVGLSVAIGFILLIIPGIFLLVKLSVAIPAVVVEDKRGREAMRRSWDLTATHFWHVFGVIIVAFLITAVVGAIFAAIGSGNDVVGVIFSTVGQILVAPFSALVTVLLYLDVRARRENLTVDALRRELGVS
ncbi:MAG TPA: glycerophosphoryl diester phosphodiesterase membrane domain-containing protein [Actinomycetota bacterium]|nr:glycerophosphoryl diester phosphodiesterase membrane domain-containing protein [Actinomycetota bacterium]